MKMGPISWIAFVLTVIGGLNWGLVGIFNFDLVVWILGSMPIVVKIVYILVGLSAIIMIVRPFMKAKDTSAVPQV
jgi:uncharacterized membrane protein YuzA (DUF378 family)